MLPWELWDAPIEWVLWAGWQLDDVERVEALLAEGEALRNARFMARAAWHPQGLRPEHEDWTRRVQLSGRERNDTDPIEKAHALIARIERGKVLH